MKKYNLFRAFNCRTLLIWILLIVHLPRLNSQDIKCIHTPHYFAPLYVVITEHTLFEELHEIIYEEAKTKQSSYALINGTNLNPRDIKDSINVLLNSELVIGKRNVYLLIFGDCEFFENHNKYTNDFFPARYFVQTSGGECNYPGFYHQHYNSLDFNEIYAKLNEKTLWEIDLEQIKTNHRSDYHLSKAEHGIGLGLSLSKPYGIRYDSYLPRSFLTYDIYGYRRINENWKIYGNLTLGFKIPDPEKIMKEEMQSQMDYSSMRSGGNITVNLDTEIEGRMFFSGSLESRKYLNTSNKIKPFWGIGISYTSFMNMYTEIDTSITMNSSSMMGGGGDFGGGSFDFSGENRNMDMEHVYFKYFGMVLSTGFEYPLGDIVLFNFRTSYNLSSNTFNSNTETFNNLNLQWGLTLRLQGKKYKYYNFVRLK
ncbi:MAG: hypothetical protein MI922_19490 [Bacteroidales bacterium]|nr:hypothetical protein [Bacteroidales bacterium]